MNTARLYRVSCDRSVTFLGSMFYEDMLDVDAAITREHLSSASGGEVFFAAQQDGRILVTYNVVVNAKALVRR